MNLNSRFGRAAKSSAIGAALVLALSGCLKIDLDVAVSNDDTVSGTYVYALFDDTGSLDGSTIEALETDEYVSAEDFNDGTYTGKQYTITDQPLDLFFATNTTQAVLSISRDGDDLVVSGQLDLTDSDSDAAAVEERRSQADVRVRITLPGDIYQSDGNISGNTITWVGEWDENTPINARSFSPLGGAIPSPTPSASETTTPSAAPSESLSPSPTPEATDDGVLIAPPVEGVIGEAADNFWSSIGLPIVIGMAGLGLLLVAGIVLLIVLLNKKKQSPGQVNAPSTSASQPLQADADATQVLPKPPAAD